MTMDFPIVDTHVHVWDPTTMRYHWLEGFPLLNRPYLPADFRAACGQIEVSAMVFVQAEVARSQSHAEAEWVTMLAGEREPRIEGIIPWAPLERGEEARPELAALARNPLVKGIRRIIQGEADPEFCVRPSFVAGVRALPDYGLHFEIAIDHTLMPGALKLVAQCPDVAFILNHIGGPDIRNHLMEPWKSELRALSRFPNVWCKVSGLVTQADHERWKDDDLKPYIDHVIDCFSFDRVMYGGDWPVARLAADYPVWLRTLELAVSGCSEDELRRLFRDNAIEFYRLG
jgi:L-fuconolactonase